MNRLQISMMVKSLRRNGYTNIQELTYGQVQELYPRYIELSTRVNREMKEPIPSLDDYVIITPEAVEYIVGIEHAQTKMEMEFYFDMLLYQAGEHALTFFTETTKNVTKEAREQIREKSSKVLDMFRPTVSRIATEIFG